MFWSRFYLKRRHYFCVFLFVRVILWKFSFSAKSTSSVYVIIYIPDEFLWTWKFFHRIFWNLENILNTFIDLISLIFMEIWSTLAKLLPKKQFCCRKSHVELHIFHLKFETASGTINNLFLDEITWLMSNRKSSWSGKE